MLSGCGITLTAPLSIDKTMYVAINQQVMDRCKNVIVTGNPKVAGSGLSLRVPQTSSSPEVPRPYHVGVAANGYPISDLTAAEVDGQVKGIVYFSQITLKRAGAYVFRAALSGATTFNVLLNCQATSEAFPITVSSQLDVSPSSFYAPVVFRISQAPGGALSAALKEFPKGATPEQLGLP